MLYRDLRQFINDLEDAGELRRVREEVDCVLEAACIADQMANLPSEQNKALLFEKVRGHSMPILMNAYGSEKRLCMMAGVRNYQNMTQKLSGFLEVLQEPRRNLIEKLGALPVLREVARCFPKYVGRGACQQQVFTGDEINLDSIPILKTWPEDAGHFVTLPLVFTKDPIDGKRNCGMYRLQRYDKRTLGFHCHTHHTGADHIRKAKAKGLDRIEIAVAIGAEPAVTFSAVVPLPPGLDEMIFAGFLNEAPVKMVKCVSVDQEVPASAEIVLEGYVNVDERRREGPFGDHTGHYSLADDYWVFHVTAVTMRDDPIYHATVVGPPPQEDSYMAEAIERLFLPLMQQPLPEVVDYHLPFEGVAHNLMLCQIDKHYPGQGKKVAHSVWGLGQAMFTKVFCVMDDGDAMRELRTKRYQEFAKRVARDLDVSRDIEFVMGPTETLDHASRELHFGSKVSFDMTSVFVGEGDRAMPPETSVSPTDEEMLKAIQERCPRVTGIHTPWEGEWRNLTLIALDKAIEGSGSLSASRNADMDIRAPGKALEPGQRDISTLTAITAAEAVRAIWELYPDLACAQRIVVFDKGEELSDYPRLAWLALSNIDPERDFIFDDQLVEAQGKQKLQRHPRRLGVDCTTKSTVDGFTRRWPKEQRWPEDLLKSVKQKMGWE